MSNVPNNRRFLNWLLPMFILASIGLAACAPAGNLLEGTNWKLASFRDEAGQMSAAIPGSVVTALFQEAQVSGIAGCNNYSGGYVLSGNDLSFGPMATTRKFCPEPGVMQQESAFLAALAQVKSYQINGGKLEMRDEKRDTLLIFEAQ